MPSRHTTAAGLLLILLAACGAVFIGDARMSATGAPQGPARLFAGAPPRGASARAARPSAMRSRTVTIDPDAWPATQRDDPRTAPASLLLNLFDDASYTADLERIERTASGFAWVGRVRGRPLSSVTLASTGDAMAGSVIMPGAAYSIRSGADGAIEIIQVDTSKLPPDAEPIPARVPMPSSAASTPSAANAAIPPAGAAADDVVTSEDTGSPTIDVMVLYTAAARAAAGSTSAMAALIDLGISDTNTSYANSAITQRLRLVRTEEVSYTEHDALSTDLYNLSNDDGSSTLSTDLGNAAAMLRNIHGADEVVLITAPAAPNACGIAWLMSSVGSYFSSYAFAVVEHSCVSPNGSFGHELGHNMGARHDWYIDNSTTPYTYSHGFVNTTASPYWRTMMSYNNLCTVKSISCPRVLYWSNPDVSYDGTPMGIAGGTKSDCPKGNANNVSCDADDHRTLNETASTVSAFRSGWRRAASDLTPDLKSDVIWRHASQGDMWLWPMDGTTRSSQTYVQTVADTTWQIRGLGDQTGDGRADILWRNSVSGQIYFWPMNANAPDAETYVDTVSTAYDIAGAGDFDGDGKSDILWRNAASGEVWIWLMNGATPTSQVYVDTVEPGYEIKGVGDLDGDLKADIVWHHQTTGEVWVWRMNGTTRLSKTYVDSVPDTGYEIKAVVDFTGDGKAAILWQHATRGDVWIWTMNGATRTAQAWAGTVPDTHYGVAAAGDYDGDGKADILWWNSFTGEVWIWLMDGTTKLSETFVGIVPDTGYRIIK
jgi:hypothetical protein